MRHKTLLLCALVAIPFATATTASAQRGGGRGGGAPSGDNPGPARAQRPPSAGDLQDLNPASLLVDKRKKLTLADSQVNQMKALEKKIKERNAPIFAEYDSVRREMRFPNSAPPTGSLGGSKGRTSPSGSGGFGGGDGAGLGTSPEAMAKLREQMQALAAIGLKLQERRPADVAESLALLTPDQVTKAREFIDEQDQEFDRILPRGRGGRPPG